MNILNKVLNYVKEIRYLHSLNNKNIHKAVQLWCNNQENAIKYYGHVIAIGK